MCYILCVFVALGVQHAMRTRLIAICGLSGCTLFFHIFKKGTILKKKSYLTQNVCFDFPHNFKTFLILRRTDRGIVTNVHTPVFV